MAAKKQAKALSGRRTVILELPEELLGRVERYTDEMVKADPSYRRRSRNAALIVLIDAGLEAASATPAKKSARG
jgi:hypothetical protein